MLAATAIAGLTLVATGLDADPSVWAAVQAYEEGETVRALRLARGAMRPGNGDANAATTGAAALVEAFSLLHLGRVEESRAALDTLAVRGPSLGTYLVFLRARVAAAAGNCTAAEELAEQVPDNSAFRFASWTQVAQCSIRAGDREPSERAMALLEDGVTSSTRRAEVALLKARLAEAVGDIDGAGALYRYVLVQYPLHRAGRRAGERLSALKLRGVAVRPLQGEDLLPRAEAQRSWRRPRRARRTYRSVISQSRRKNQPALRDQAELGLVELDMVDKRYAPALRRLNAVLSRVEDPALQAQALFLKGDVLARRGRTTEAIVTFEEALREQPDEPYTTEAAMAAARLSYGAGRLDRARQFAQWVLQSQEAETVVAAVGRDGARGAAGDGEQMRAEALWLLAWIERSSGADPDSVGEILAQIPDDVSHGPAALYWRARLAVDLGDLRRAEALAERVLHCAPTSFYAFAASELMNAVQPGCNVRLDLPQPSQDTSVTPAPQPDDLQGALTLFEHGLQSEARRVLQLVPSHTLSFADRLTAAWLYRNCGEVHRAAVLARPVASAPSAPLHSGVLLDLAYPRVFVDTIAEAAQDHGVSEELILAVIREESAFNPRAVSPRYARGLMQMIRPTAKSMAREAGLRRFHFNDLFKPEVSVKLGAQYLALLLARFDGNLVAAVAAYHAGESAVDRWVRARGYLPLDEFIEDIPYASTRGYVKKVLGSLGIYHLLRGNGPQPLLGLRQSERREPRDDTATAEPAEAEAASRDVAEEPQAQDVIEQARGAADEVDAADRVPPSAPAPLSVSAGAGASIAPAP